MSKYALDCEMVGSYKTNLLARVTIVDQYGRVVLDEYVKPIAQVTDYRSCVSGIKKHHLINGKHMMEVKTKVKSILRGNILIGHSLHYDMGALGLSHPKSKIRDLAKYQPLMSNGQPVALKTLARLYVYKSIQDGEHDSKEDARACMDIYHKISHEWEKNC